MPVVESDLDPLQRGVKRRSWRMRIVHYPKRFAMDLYTLRTITFWTFMGLGLVSLAYPWRVSTRWSRVFVHLPLLMVGVLCVHEWAMPAGLAARVDLLAIVTLSGPVFGAYCFRLCVLAGKGSLRSKAPARLAELSWSERRALLPFNDESEGEQLAKFGAR